MVKKERMSPIFPLNPGLFNLSLCLIICLAALFVLILSGLPFERSYFLLITVASVFRLPIAYCLLTD